MAAVRRFRSRGAPRRAAGSAIFVARTPIEATGGWSHKPTASYGTVPSPVPGDPAASQYPLPPAAFGPGRTSANEGEEYPAWSYEPTWRFGPKVLPTAGAIPHGIPQVTTTLAVNTGMGAVAGSRTGRPAPTKQTGGGQSRITRAPKASYRWKQQGGR